MISGVDPSAEQFLANLARTQARAELAQRQIASGLRFQDASDAPDQVSDILKLRVDIAHNTQVSSNLGAVKTEVDTAEQAIEGAVQLVERARTLATQGANSTQTVASRIQIAQEVSSIHGQLVALSATQVGGRFLFGGDSDSTAPYQIDTVTPDVAGGVVQNTATQATRLIEDPVGNTFSVDRTAQQIFDDQNPPGTPAPDNVFVAVNQLRVALEANDDAGIQNAMSALITAGDYLNTQLGFYGTSQNRISAASDLAGKLDIEFQTALSGKQDADLAAAILEGNQAQIQLQASLQARAGLRKISLFDYLS